jgi:uncharacterized Fe-S radical SAM superfamily protein PflX
MLPLYLEKLNPVELKNRSEILRQLLAECRICPNECAINRLEGEAGNCNSTDEVNVRTAEQVGVNVAENIPVHVFIVKPHNFEATRNIRL